VRAALALPYRLNIESFSRLAGLHPELVARLVRLGLLDATLGPRGELYFTPADVARAARIQRLRAGLTLNYAAIGVVIDLLDRIDVLEAALRTRPRPNGGSDRRWT
jgi:DNA-binding transcriptional MerR regulator